MTKSDEKEGGDAKKDDLSVEKILKENGYSYEWLLEHMEKNKEFQKIKGDRELSKVDVKNIGDGKGYCAQVFRVKFVFDGEEKKNDYSIVMKIPTDELITETFDEEDLSKEMEENLRALAWTLHDRECAAHEVLKELRASDFPIPNIYGSDKHGEERPGILLMEDMSEAGVNVEALDTLSAEQCISLGRRFGDFQAFVEMLPEDAWNNQFKESVHIRKENEKEIKKKLKPVLEFRPEEQKNMVQHYMDMDFYELCKYALRDFSEEQNASSLLHGDAWSHNILFEKNADGSISDKMTGILDWATLFEGNPLFDIARFVICCTDGEIRRECLSRVLDGYYESLQKKLADHSKKPRFSRQQVDDLYEMAALRQTAALVELFSSDGLPLFKNEDGEEKDVEKGEKLWKRVRLALEDTAELMKKYEIVEKFSTKKK